MTKSNCRKHQRKSWTFIPYRKKLIGLSVFWKSCFLDFSWASIISDRIRFILFILDKNHQLLDFSSNIEFPRLRKSLQYKIFQNSNDNHMLRITWISNLSCKTNTTLLDSNPVAGLFDPLASDTSLGCLTKWSPRWFLKNFCPKKISPQMDQKRLKYLF